MLLKIQGNINDSFSSPLQVNQNDIIYCNTGGKPNMSLIAKNIPPMVANTIPQEIQIRDSLESDTYSKIRSYNPSCMLNDQCSTETPFFAFQLIYDGYDFLYYPEFKLYEKPYLILERNYTYGTDTLTFSNIETPLNDNFKNLNFFDAGDILTFLDTEDVYTITEREVVGTDIVFILNKALTMDHSINDVCVNDNKKFSDKTDSNLLYENTTISLFKFKFCDPLNLNNKNYAVSEESKIDDTYSTLINNNTTNITDLQGDDKIVSISNNIQIEATNIALNNNIDITDIELEFTSNINNILHINSYLTLKNLTTIEIVKVTAILSDTTIKIERGQLDTEIGEFTSATTSLFFPKYIYFQMLPVNKSIDYRYVVYRNIDFVLTWV